MVKVECSGCSAPYQLDERRIPPAGLKMRCPKCGTSMHVARPGGEGAAAPPAAPRPAPRPAPAAPAAPAPANEWSGVDLPAPAAARGFGAPAAPSGGAGFGEIDLSVDTDGGGDDGGVGLPVVAGAPSFADSVGLPAPRAARAAPPPPDPGGFGSLGDFGSLDLGDGGDDGEAGAVDLPATREADPYSGVDLPAVRPGRTGMPAALGGALGGVPASAPGLPMPRPQDAGAAGLPMPAGGRSGGLPAVMGGRPATAPHRTHLGVGMESEPSGVPIPPGGMPGLPMPAGRGAGLPMPAGGPSNVGLPAVAPGGAALPSFGGQGGLGLPASAGGGAGLPMPAGPGAGLPMSAGGGAGLPMTALGGAGLPMPSGGGAGLPMPSGGGAGLPMPGGGGAGLPMPGGGLGLPSTGGAGFPAVGGPGLPVVGGAGLPLAGSAGLPSIGGVGLPNAQGAGLPSSAGPGLPSSSHAGLPIVGATGLPAIGGQGLPMTPGATGAQDRRMSGVMPAGLGLASSSAGTEASFGDPNAGGVNVGSVDLGSMGSGVGGEMDLDASTGGPGPSGGSLFAKKERSSTTADEPDVPVSRSRGLKIVAGTMVGLAAVGLAMSLEPSWGPFGAHLISDSMNQSAYDEAVRALRTGVQQTLDDDTVPSAVAAAERAKAEQRERERHAETAAYTSFVIYMKSLRFGRDGGMETTAKALLEGVPREKETAPLLLALAASDALDGELARARQTVDRVQSMEPEDVDAAVLAGEIELKSKDPSAAVLAFTKATTLHKSARTLYGLARAQHAQGKAAEAEATARGVLEVSKQHVGARILIATIATATPSREPEALKLLVEVTDGPELKANASEAELVDAYVQLGRVQTLGSRISQAQEAFANALKLNPQSVAALVGSGELYYRSSRYSEAEARFESALKADADNLEAKIGTAKTWIALERTKEAKEHLKKLVQAYPQEPQVDYWSGRVNELLGQRKDAEASYRAAIGKAKTAEQGVPSYVALAALLASTNRSEDAAGLLSEASAKYPGSAELAKARGEVALRSGKLDEALAQFEVALQKAPEDLSTRFSLGQTLMKMRKFDQAIAVFDAIQKVDAEYPGLALERGLFFEETGQSDEALRMYEEALRKAPNDIDLKLRIASTQVAAGAAKQAEPILKEVIRERGNSAEANHYLGRAMLLSGSNLNEAMRHLKRAVELDANRAEYHLYVGWAANEAGQPTIAEAALERALELDASLGDAYWQRGVQYQKQGKIEAALRDLEIALEKRPSRYEAHATMALCYESQNNLSKAEASWRKAIAGNDKIAEFHYKLGELLDRNGNKKEALTELEKALDLATTKDPKPAWLFRAHWLLGEAFEASKPEKALANYQEYLRLAPKDDAYRGDVEAAVETLKKKVK